MTGTSLTAGRRMSAEAIVLIGGGAAILLQISHPAVAAGVARHSDFAAAPLRRLEGTLDFVIAVVHGNESERQFVTKRVNTIHRSVRGRSGDIRYDARDPELQLWVASTLYYAARAAHERVFGKASSADEESLLACFAAISEVLQVPAARWHGSVREFDRWWDAELASKRAGQDARVIFQQLRYAAGAPAYLRILLPVVWRIALAMLPARLRREFYPEWSKRDRFVAELYWAMVVLVYRLLPRRVRTLTVAWQLRHVRKTMRRERESNRQENGW
ncbi:oxygenase MpaB family protein [Gulosibacter molinativorax]|nr:oxygenase MpaB family protein [Gulosibacter molinativorax]